MVVAWALTASVRTLLPLNNKHVMLLPERNKSSNEEKKHRDKSLGHQKDKPCKLPWTDFKEEPDIMLEQEGWL